jgi:hypothetical protein
MAFGRVGGERCRAGCGVEDGAEEFGEGVGVVDSGVGSESAPGRHLVCGVTGEEDPRITFAEPVLPPGRP